MDDQPSSRNTSLQPTMGVGRPFWLINLCHAKISVFFRSRLYHDIRPAVASELGFGTEYEDHHNAKTGL
jgi:hypothetical protein